MYGIKNLQRIIPNLLEWTKEENKDYSNLSDIYGQLTGQFSRYMVHVARNVGGIYLTPKTVEDTGVVYENEPKAKQKEAIAFLNNQLFTTPSWIIGNGIFDRIGGSPLITIGNVQDNVLNRLFSTNTLNKLIQAEAKTGSQAYSITELFGDLKKGIWSELVAKKPIDVYRRNLQKIVYQHISNFLNPCHLRANKLLGRHKHYYFCRPDKSDIQSVVRAHLVSS
jgi:hypothetical protein